MVWVRPRVWAAAGVVVAMAGEQEAVCVEGAGSVTG